MFFRAPERLLGASLFLAACVPAGSTGIRPAQPAGSYLGQAPPGLQARLFAPGFVSTGLGELNAAFTPGGDELLWSVSLGPMRWQLVASRRTNGAWSLPRTVPFAGIWGGVDVVVAPDGRRILFCSNRPRPGRTRCEEDFDIWWVDRTEAGWSAPVNPGPPVNSEAHEFYPSLAADGTLVFTSRRAGGPGGGDVYLARPAGASYPTVELLPEPVSSAAGEGDTMIAPDGSYLVVTTRRDDSPADRGSDLYVTFRTDGGWTPLVNLGPGVNSDGSENCPILSPDGRYLFFTSNRLRPELSSALYDITAHRDLWGEPGNGLQDVYWVDAGVIGRLRPVATTGAP